MSDNAKTWAERVTAARAEVLGGSAATLTRTALIRMELADNLEQAHERAVQNAKDLASAVQRLLAELETEGLATRDTAYPCVTRAQDTRDALLALDRAREVFATVLRVERERAKDA